MPRVHGKAWERWLASTPATATHTPPPSRAPRARRTAARFAVNDPAPAIPPVQVLDGVRPTPAPRQSRRDTWDPRPCVMRYRAYCDALRLHRLLVPERFVFIFYLPMPRSWSERHRAQANGKPHTPKPDADNLGKSTLDALVARDQGHWDTRNVKLWAYTPRIVIVDPTRVAVDDAFLAAHVPPAP